MLSRIAVAVAIIATLSCGGPAFKTYERNGLYFLDFQFLGEYPTTVDRIQLKCGDDLIWEVRAKGGIAQIHLITLQLGRNPAAVASPFFGEYETVFPSADHFTLEPNQRYTVLAWEGCCWASRETFETNAEQARPGAERPGTSLKRTGNGGNRVTDTVDCDLHGVQPETFVCQHIANSLHTGRRVGFFWSQDADEPRPDAWCAECDERAKKTGGEWVGEAAEHLSAQLLCGECYDNAKRLCLEGGQ